MKKIKIISLIIAGALIIMFSCTKENNENNKTVPKKYFSSETRDLLQKF